MELQPWVGHGETTCAHVEHISQAAQAKACPVHPACATPPTERTEPTDLPNPPNQASFLLLSHSPGRLVIASLETHKQHLG